MWRGWERGEDIGEVDMNPSPQDNINLLIGSQVSIVFFLFIYLF